MNQANQNPPLTHIKSVLQAISWEPWLLAASGVLKANISRLK